MEVAYKKFDIAKRELIANVERAGLVIGREAVAGRGPGSAQSQKLRDVRGVAAELGVFALKGVIVLIIVGAAGISVGRSISGSIDRLGESIAPKSISMVDVVHKFAEIARDVQDLSESDRELLKQSIGKLSREIDPVVDAWRNPPASPKD
jgi:hypothetical protein